MTNVSPDDAQKYLEGMTFPARRIDIIKHAKDKEAPDQIMAMLEMLPDEAYQNPTEVTETLEDAALDIKDGAPVLAAEEEDDDEEETEKE